MPYEIQAEPGEKVLLDLAFQVSEESESFRFGVSDRALYLPSKRFVVAGDPRCFRRVPRAQVIEVRVQDLRPHGLWIAAALMAAAGLVTQILMLMPFFTDLEGEFVLSGWPLALLVGGLLLPLAARGRQRMVVRMVDRSFKWYPPLVVDRASKRRIAATLAEIVAACRTAGLQVNDERRTAAQTCS
jgi:hypothetical protein